MNVKQKVLGLGLGLVALSSNAMAAVSYTAGTGFSGDFDLVPFYSGIGIAVGAIAIVASIRLALGVFKRVN